MVDGNQDSSSTLLLPPLPDDRTTVMEIILYLLAKLARHFHSLLRVWRAAFSPAAFVEHHIR
jgi:hypothetical protein